MVTSLPKKLFCKKQNISEDIQLASIFSILFDIFSSLYLPIVSHHKLWLPELENQASAFQPFYQKNAWSNMARIFARDPYLRDH